MSKLKLAVIGTGYLGSLHAKIYKTVETCSLEAVCDIDLTRLREVSDSLGVKGYTDFKDLFGAVDAVEGIVRRIKAEIGKDARVIATGGLAPVISRYTTVIEKCEPSLVLEGIRLIYERIQRERKQ